MNYATVQDIIDSGRALTADEMKIAETKIVEASAMIRRKAKSHKLDFDKMIMNDTDLGTVARSVVTSCVIRYLNDKKNEPAMTQMSQSAGGYSISGTFAAAGSRVSIWKAEWQLLGLGQVVGTLELFGNDAD